MPTTNLTVQWNCLFAISTPILAIVTLLLSVTNCSSSSSSGLHPDILTGSISHGVASGDVTSNSALIWLRTDGPAQGQVRLATIADWERVGSGNAQQPSLKTVQFSSAKEHDFTVKVPIEGLISATRYHYDIQIIEPAQLPVATAVTAQGEFMTAPSPEQSIPITFLWSADLGGQNRCRDEQAGYPIFDVMRIQKPDFMILLGDIIYSDDRCLSPPNAPGSEFKASTLDHIGEASLPTWIASASTVSCVGSHLGNLG